MIATPHTADSSPSALLQQARFISAGQFSAQQPWLHPRRVIDSYELIFVLRGRIALREQDETAVAAAGEWLLLRPGVEHGGVGVPVSDASFWWFHFSLPAQPTALRGPLLELQEKACGLRAMELARQLLYYAGVPDYPAVCRDALVALILTELTRALTADPADPLMAQAAEWIRINRDLPLSAAAVAEHFGYHRDYLSRRFKAVYGMGLKEYIVRQKLALARQLLLDGSMPLKQVAAAAGYGEYKLFLKVFTYHEHMTPTQYRQLYTGVHTNKR